MTECHLIFFATMHTPPKSSGTPTQFYYVPLTKTLTETQTGKCANFHFRAFIIFQGQISFIQQLKFII